MSLQVGIASDYQFSEGGGVCLPTYGRTVTVGKSGAVDFNTIAEAYIAAKALSPSITNRIAILIFPGLYVENLILETDYIDLIGISRQGSIIESGIVGYTITKTSIYNLIQNLTVRNTQNGYIDAGAFTESDASSWKENLIKDTTFIGKGRYAVKHLWGHFEGCHFVNSQTPGEIICENYAAYFIHEGTYIKFCKFLSPAGRGVCELHGMEWWPGLEYSAIISKYTAVVNAVDLMIRFCTFHSFQGAAFGFVGDWVEINHSNAIGGGTEYPGNDVPIINNFGGKIRNSVVKSYHLSTVTTPGIIVSGILDPTIVNVHFFMSTEAVSCIAGKSDGNYPVKLGGITSSKPIDNTHLNITWIDITAP
jgi:hypothetical protein